MPSRLMNSWAKVMSRDALARSFSASSLASMLDDWMRSWSWTAVWNWRGRAGNVSPRRHPPAAGTCSCTYRGGGQPQDRSVLDVVAILRKGRGVSDALAGRRGDPMTNLLCDVEICRVSNLQSKVFMVPQRPAERHEVERRNRETVALRVKWKINANENGDSPLAHFFNDG